MSVIPLAIQPNFFSGFYTVLSFIAKHLLKFLFSLSHPPLFIPCPCQIRASSIYIFLNFTALHPFTRQTKKRPKLPDNPETSDAYVS